MKPPTLETTYASSGNKHFFNEQPPRTSQNSDFQSRLSVLKIGRIFPKKNSVKKIELGDKKHFLKILVFKVLYFLKCAQFLSPLFIILVGLTLTLFSEKMLIPSRCICGFMPNSKKKS